MSPQPAQRTRVPYKRSFRPSVAACEGLIVDAWYDLCDRQKRGDLTGVGISTTKLHDLGVFLLRARKREARAVAA